MTEPLGRVRLLCLPHQLAGSRFDGTQHGVGAGQVDLVPIDREAADLAGRTRAADHRATPELPDKVAGPAVDRLDDVAAIDHIDDAVVDERRALVGSISDGPHPCEPELLHVVAGDLAKRAVALAVECAAPTQPVFRRGVSGEAHR